MQIERLTWRMVSENDPGSWAIQRVSFGNASHIGFMVDGQELGARFDLVGGKPRGVEWRKADYAHFASETYIDWEVPAEKARLYKSFSYAQEHKPYDWRAILGFASGRDWRDDKAWICSELVAASLEYAGLCGDLYLRANKITPVACGLVLTGCGAKVRP